MARVTFVKSARKDNSVAKKGESYYWWQLYKRPKRYSKTSPKRSQLTGSSFLSQMYDIEDDQIGGLKAESADDLRTEVEEIASQLRDLGSECEDSLSNMPEGLQEGDVGQMLQERVDLCESMAEELECVDLDDYDEAAEDTLEEWLEGKITELQEVSYEGE